MCDTHTSRIFEEIRGELREICARLARIEVELLTKPRAGGQRGHRVRYHQIAQYIRYAQAAADAAAAVTSVMGRD